MINPICLAGGAEFIQNQIDALRLDGYSPAVDPELFAVARDIGDAFRRATLVQNSGRVVSIETSWDGDHEPITIINFLGGRPSETVSGHLTIFAAAAAVGAEVAQPINHPKVAASLIAR